MLDLDIEKMIFQLDEPLADPAALNVLYISQLARKQGIKVLLSGAGGDELFGGYLRYFQNFRNFIYNFITCYFRVWYSRQIK